MGINDRDKSWHDLYRIKVSTAAKILVRENIDRIVTWLFDSAGVLRFAQRYGASGDQELLSVDSKSISKVYSCSQFETCAALRFDKADKRVYVVTNQGAAVNFAGLALVDPQTGKAEPVESDPLRRVDFGTATFSERTHDLAFTTYVDDRQRRYFKDKEFEADFKFLENEAARKRAEPGFEHA